jgi:uncharacterized protein
MTLYAASVPVFQRYLAQARGLALSGDMTARIAESMTAERHLSVAARYSLRIAYPLAGRAMPAEVEGGVLAQIAAALAGLEALTEADFAGAEARVISHRAGFADLSQSGADFLHLYGMPNFFFHLTMAYASLKAEGAPLGKADFDGFHHYPTEFRLPDV